MASGHDEEEAFSFSKPHHRSRPTTTLLAEVLPLLAGVLLAVVLVCSVWSLLSPTPSSLSFNTSPPPSSSSSGWTNHDDPPDVATFYDDTAVGYTVADAIAGWDDKRRDWLGSHPSLAAGAGDRVLLVTGSQPGPCKDPAGDHLLLRLFKNKVDYCRINGCHVFYNTALLHPKMFSFWAKLPVVRAAMVAHPEAEWIWWVDSDAAITDMDFRLPLHRYRNHNMVVHGWPEMVYAAGSGSWTSLNAGVFLIRNCQWSMDLVGKWAAMGPQSSRYDEWGKTLFAAFPDKIFPESDDQSGLTYLLRTTDARDKVYLENLFYFEGYWAEIIEKLGNITGRYREVEMSDLLLRRRRAEAVAAGYAARMEEKLAGWEYGKEGWRRPFITHFTGCQPCSGNRNQMYEGQRCLDGMAAALNFADDQVLRSYGYRHVGPLELAVRPLPF